MRPMALLAEGKGKHCASTGYWPTTKAIGSCGWSLARPDHLITSAFQVSWMSILRHKIPSAPRARRGPADRLDCRCPGLQSVLWARLSSADVYWPRGREACAGGAWPGETPLLPLLSRCRGCPSYDTYQPVRFRGVLVEPRIGPPHF